jgi:protein tyrosine/serine phosphatase
MNDEYAYAFTSNFETSVQKAWFADCPGLTVLVRDRYRQAACRELKKQLGDFGSCSKPTR